MTSGERANMRPSNIGWGIKEEPKPVDRPSTVNYDSMPHRTEGKKSQLASIAINLTTSESLDTTETVPLDTNKSTGEESSITTSKQILDKVLRKSDTSSSMSTNSRSVESVVIINENIDVESARKGFPVNLHLKAKAAPNEELDSVASARGSEAPVIDKSVVVNTTDDINSFAPAKPVKPLKLGVDKAVLTKLQTVSKEVSIATAMSILNTIDAIVEQFGVYIDVNLSFVPSMFSPNQESTSSAIVNLRGVTETICNFAWDSLSKTGSTAVISVRAL